MDNRTKLFCISHVLPIGLGTAVQLGALYKNPNNFAGAFIGGFLTSILASEILSPRVGQYAAEHGWVTG